MIFSDAIREGPTKLINSSIHSIYYNLCIFQWFKNQHHSLGPRCIIPYLYISRTNYDISAYITASDITQPLNVFLKGSITTPHTYIET